MTLAMRWAIAGPGDIGARMARALATMPDAELVAVGSRSARRAAAFAETHHAARAHGSYQDLFDDPEVDIVHIASPHSAHLEMTLAALEAGKHVLCEKAFALNARQATQMVDAARRARRFLMEAMWTWFLPPINDIRERIAAGEIGEVRVVRADFSRAAPGRTGRLRELGLGGGALLDMGVYPVSLSRLLLGQPTDVRALGHLGPTGVDANMGVVLSHEGGALAVLHTGLDALGTLRAEIIGTEGTITVDPPFWATSGFSVRRHGNDPMTLFDGSSAPHVRMEHHGLAHEVAHVMARVRAGELESDVLPLAMSLEVMQTLDEIRRQVGVVYDADADADADADSDPDSAARHAGPIGSGAAAR